MKVIFLDIDGVLNYSECWKREENKGKGGLIWDNDCVAQLNRIVKETGAKIVVSSSWRILGSHYDAVLNKMNIQAEILGKTPTNLPIENIRGVQRGDEIQAWMNTQQIEPIEKFVILDDDSDMCHLKDRLVQSNFMGKGLTRELADKAIEMLS